MAVLYKDPLAPPPDVEYPVARAMSPAEALLRGDAPGWVDARIIGWGPAEYATCFRALWSSSHLHLRFDCIDPSPWHTMRARDEHLWEEEVVEIFLDVTARGEHYAELEISPANVVCDLRVRRPWPALAADIDWDAEGLATRTRQHAGEWTATASLPWTALASLSPDVAARLPPRAGDRWGFNVFRIKRPGGPSAPEADAVYAAWSVPDAPSFHVPAAFRGLRFL